MGKYVDGFVLPVPKKNVDLYRQFSEKAGKVTSFPQAVKLEPVETVVFAWIVYESREHRDRVNAAVMAGPRMADMDPKTMPFDGMRMFWGGFEVLIAL